VRITSPDRNEFDMEKERKTMNARAGEDEIKLLDFLIAIFKRKWLIVTITFTFIAIAAIVSLLLPEIYKAEVRILPSNKSSSSASAMLGQLTGGLGLDLLGISGGGTGDLYAGMIQGNTVIDGMIDRFDLMRLYDKEYMIDARQELRNNVDVSVDSKSGIVSIIVEDRDPKRAAQMANAFVEELNELTKGLAISEASQRRLFFENQLKEMKNALTTAEVEMQKFQEKTGVLKMEDQAAAVIETIAKLRAQIAAKEVEIRAMKTFAAPSYPELVAAVEALKGMKDQLVKLEASRSGYDPLMPTGRMPEVGVEYLRKLRELKYNETLFELIVKQYEMARIDESREAAVIQIVDEAVPPDKRSSPKRGLMVSVAAFVGFMMSVFVIFLLEFIERSSDDPDQRERIKILKKHLRLRARRSAVLEDAENAEKQRGGPSE